MQSVLWYTNPSRVIIGERKEVSILPKSAKQKLKLLYLMKILLEKTDENNMLTVSQMIEQLARYDIRAERKSIYDDLEALRVYGVDIECVKSKTTVYYVASRTFELPELKVLVDSVQVSKFISFRKSIQLIKKLETLCSKHEAQALNRQVFVANRVKMMNESIYYNVDKIQNAISMDKQISYKYCEYTLTKEKRFKREGERYFVSPCALHWDDENYYLLAYENAAAKIKYFRVDKMEDIDILEEKRNCEDYSNIDLAAYAKKVFRMFGGEEQIVKLEFD
ncbi:MAG: WYL domain-containing protein, partial [Clostridia bacterium]|nr:WYL domain-containing protein [Clostridia bacterium]